MTEVAVAIIVPAGSDPLDHRAQVRKRGFELGWGEPDSEGLTPIDPPVVDLQWTVEMCDDHLEQGIALLWKEFDVADVHTGEPSTVIAIGPNGEGVVVVAHSDGTISTVVVGTDSRGHIDIFIEAPQGFGIHVESNRNDK